MVVLFRYSKMCQDKDGSKGRMLTCYNKIAWHALWNFGRPPNLYVHGCQCSRLLYALRTSSCRSSRWDQSLYGILWLFLLRWWCLRSKFFQPGQCAMCFNRRLQERPRTWRKMSAPTWSTVKWPSKISDDSGVDSETKLLLTRAGKLLDIANMNLFYYITTSDWLTFQSVIFRHFWNRRVAFENDGVPSPSRFVWYQVAVQ